MSTSTSKRCSKCKVIRDVTCFGIKRNGEEYKTCIKCRSKNKDTAAHNTSPLKTNRCLPSCYDPYKCIHDKACKNFGLSCINLNYKPFLNYLDVIDTICGEYGYCERPLPKGPTKMPLTFNAIEYCRDSIGDIDYEVQNYKTTCIVKYDGAYDFMTDMFMESLSPQARDYAFDCRPCVVVKFHHKGDICTLILNSCNSFEYFFTKNKLKNPKRCDICLEKTRYFMNCYRCGNRCCEMCLRSMSSLTCPYCNYDIVEHHCNMCNLYDITD